MLLKFEHETVNTKTKGMNKIASTSSHLFYSDLIAKIL